MRLVCVTNGWPTWLPKPRQFWRVVVVTDGVAAGAGVDATPDATAVSSNSPPPNLLIKSSKPICEVVFVKEAPGALADGLWWLGTHL